MPFKFAALELLVNPNTVFLLLTIGLILIGLELFNPGMILPGTLGGVSLILALFGLAQLPINVAGLLLILLAFGLFAAEAFVISHGALAVGGVVALAFGGLLLFDTDSEAFEISVPVVLLTAAVAGRVLRVADQQGGAGTARAGAHGHGGADRRPRRGALAPRAHGSRVREGSAVASAVGRMRGLRSATRWWSRKSTG